MMKTSHAWPSFGAYVGRRWQSLYYDNLADKQDSHVGDMAAILTGKILAHNEDNSRGIRTNDVASGVDTVVLHMSTSLSKQVGSSC